MAEFLDETLETSEDTQKGKFLTFSVGLIVDNVAEVINIDDSNIVPPPGTKTGFHNRYVRGIGEVGKEVRLLLDCAKLLNDEDLGKITEKV